ncbi:hypothetical protein IP84_06430 [beta proteobacterium AAP99]|nr:hypothetical protein IP84_06430 [beta proteobacterium AAP99]
MLRPACLLAALLAGPTQAANHIVDLKWQDGAFSHETTIAAGKYFEVCGALAQGSKVDWQFEAAAPTDFNIHYHFAKETVYAVKQAAVRTAQNRFEAPKAETYCWMWTNLGSASLRLSVRLQQAS